MQKISFFKKSCSSKQNWQHIFVRGMLRNVIPSFCLFRGMDRNRIPNVCLNFCSTERNSELFSLLRNGSEWNSKCLLLTLFHGTEFRSFFSSAERFGTEFREFSFPRNNRNSVGTNQLFRLFRLPQNNFLVRNCQPYFCSVATFWTLIIF